MKRMKHEKPDLAELKANEKSVYRKMELNRLKQGLKIVSKYPFIIPKLIKNYLQTLRGEFPLRSLELAVGYECNFGCDQCSCASNHNPKRERLTVKQFKGVVDQAVQMGAFQFNLNGGEPLLYYDEVREMCRYIRKKGCYVHMATNGYYFTPDMIWDMKDAGLCSFEMGLDSSIEVVHDQNRHEGSYKKIMRNVEEAHKLRLGVSFNTVSTKEKIWNGDLLDTVLLAKKMSVMLMITPPCVTGNWSGKLDVLLNEDEKWYVRWILSSFPETRLDNYNGLKGLSCPAAREKMAVNPYGDVVSCPLIQIVYGNVNSDRLKTIQEKMLKDPFYFKNLRDGCLPSHDMDFINERLVKERDS